MESTQQFARPRFEASQIDPRDPLGLGLVEPVLPSVPNPARPEPVRQEQARPEPVRQEQARPEPMALPTGPSGGAAEQPWYPQEGGQETRPRTYQPRRPGTSAPEFQPSDPQGRQGRPAQAPQPQAPQQAAQAQAPQAPQPQAPQQGQQQPQQGQQPQPGTGDAPWRPSANDERWRRAEQVREPSTNGVTMSGLPGGPRRPTWSPAPPRPRR